MFSRWLNFTINTNNYYLFTCIFIAVLFDLYCVLHRVSTMVYMYKHIRHRSMLYSLYWMCFVVRNDVSYFHFPIYYLLCISIYVFIRFFFVFFVHVDEPLNSTMFFSKLIFKFPQFQWMNSLLWHKLRVASSFFYLFTS